MLGAASAHDFGGIDSSQVEIFLTVSPFPLERI